MVFIRHNSICNMAIPTTNNTILNISIYVIYYIMDISSPKLIEPGIYTYLKYSLKECHLYKWKYYSYIINIALFGIWALFIGLFCYWHYKGAPSVAEQQAKQNKIQKYITDKIANYRISKQKYHQELITSLPAF
jgi:hypothetical protein